MNCCVCSQPLDEEDSHVWHEAACAVVRAAQATTEWSGHDFDCEASYCGGDRGCHEECCPVCAAERMIEPIRAHLQWVQDTMKTGAT